MSVGTRVKRQLAIHGGTLGVVVVLFAFLCFGGAGYVYLNPPVQEIPPEEIDVQNFEVAVDHHAVVTNQTPLYTENTTLRNQPVYFANATPELTFSTRADVPSNREVNISYRLVLRHYAQFNDQVFWEQREVLDAGERTVTNGNFISNTSLRIPAVRADRSTYQNALGTTGSLFTELQVQLSYESPAPNDETYSGTVTASSPFRVTGNAFWLEQALSGDATKRQMSQAQVRQQPPNLQLVGILGAVGALLLLGGAWVTWWSSREVEIYELELEVVKEKYDEWISEGEFPTDSANQHVFINSLEDLVDVAIDTNKRVIHDPDLETYSVVDGEVVYYHASEPTMVRSWLDFSPDE
jgi:hypothetical protein